MYSLCVIIAIEHTYVYLDICFTQLAEKERSKNAEHELRSWSRIKWLILTTARRDFTSSYTE